MDGAITVLIGVLVVVGIVATAYAGYRKQQRKQESLERLLARDPRLVRTDAPCGLGVRDLPAAFRSIERGDRRSGIRYGISGPITVELAGTSRDLECAAFQWWWEERRTERTQHGSRVTYQERSTVVVLVRLPVRIPERVQLRPESMLGRVGLTRGGQQLESSEFNRRFRVSCDDRTLTIHLLDARLQALLLETYVGRSLEMRGDLLALVGRPTHRDTSLEGVIGDLPAVRMDVARLVGAVPPPFWRAVGAHV